MNLRNTNELLFLIIVVMAILATACIINSVKGLVNVTELDTLERIRFTAIQMTILDLESQQPTNMSNDEIAAKIFEIQQNNETDRLTTVQIEELYRNITAAAEQQ